MKESQTLLNQALTDEAIDITLSHARDELSRMLDEIYLPRAIPDRSDEDLNAIRCTMQVDGILPLLDHDLKLLMDAAAGSLCAALDHKLESISTFHRWTQEDPYASLTKIDDMLQKELRLPIFLMADRNVFASSI